MQPLASRHTSRPSAATAIDIVQFRYGDNLGYLLCGRRQALAVDGGAVQAILAHLERHGLRLAGICQTHDHADHTCGNAALHQATSAPQLDHRDLARRGRYRLEDAELELFSAPGHTRDSVVWRLNGAVLTGDTLFNGTVGNCFSGDLEAYFDSIQRLMALPGETVIWAGHDYVRESLAFARRLEPDNPHHDAYLARYAPQRVRSRLRDELRINPFLRFDAPTIVDLLRRKANPAATSLERWIALMQMG
jgi:hydroxyacylglutathione hydrolase